METSLSTLDQLKNRAIADNQIKKVSDKVDGSDKNFKIESGDGSESPDSSELSEREKELKDAANEVEGFFVGFMMKQMRKTINRTEGLYDRGQGEKIFQERLDKKFAQKIADSSNLGIAEQVYEQFSADKTGF